jgi:hypothetical protein
MLDFENEENLNTDAEQVSSEPTQESQPESATPVQQEAAQSKPDSATPFHEHPRFKEVIEEKNRYREELNAQRAQLAELQKQFQAAQQPKPVAPSDPMYERLKGIDPEFADYLKELKSGAAKAGELEQHLNNLKEEQFVQTAVASVNALHEKNAVAPELRDIYNQQLDMMYRQGLVRNAGDVEKAYKQVHEQYTKVLDSVRRAERESYVASKQQASKAPSSAPKGSPVKQNTKMEFSNDPNMRKQQAIQSILKQVRAEKEI